MDGHHNTTCGSRHPPPKRTVRHRHVWVNRAEGLLKLQHEQPVPREEVRAAVRRSPVLLVEPCKVRVAARVNQRPNGRRVGRPLGSAQLPHLGTRPPIRGRAAVKAAAKPVGVLVASYAVSVAVAAAVVASVTVVAAIVVAAIVVAAIAAATIPTAAIAAATVVAAAIATAAIAASAIAAAIAAATPALL